MAALAAPHRLIKMLKAKIERIAFVLQGVGPTCSIAAMMQAFQRIAVPCAHTLVGPQPRSAHCEEMGFREGSTHSKGYRSNAAILTQHHLV